MLLLLPATITLPTDFEAASLGKVERLSPAHLRCAVRGESGQDGKNRQANWLLFPAGQPARRIDLFMAFHNTESSEFAEGPVPEGESEFQTVAERLFRLLAEKTTFHPVRPLPSSGASTTPGESGRMAVYQGPYHDRKIPALLMEQMVEHNLKLGRLPRVEDRLTFGSELVRALWAAATGAEIPAVESKGGP